MGGLIGFLLGTRQVVLKEGSTWAFSFATPVSVLWFVLAGAAVMAGVAALYWRESVSLSWRQRLFFVVMRMVLVVVVLTMLAEPSIFVTTAKEGRAAVAVMLDASESMGIPDAYQDEDLERRAARAAGLLPADAPPDATLTDEDRRRLREVTRADIVEAVLRREREAFFDRLAEHFAVPVYAFDSEARLISAGPAAGPSASGGPEEDRAERPGTGAAPEAAASGVPEGFRLDPTGKSTDIGTAVRTAIKEAHAAKRALASVVVVSDGRATAGAEGLAQVAAYARQRGVPILAVADGDPSQPKDVKVSALLVNSTAFVDDPLQLTFVVESAGFEGERALAELTEDDRLLQSKNLVLLGGGRQQRETFTVRPHAPGQHTYSVNVRPLPGELIEANNAASALVEVIKDKIRVLLVEGAPRWEYRFLKNALMRDEGLLVSCLLASAEAGFIQEGNLRIDHFPSEPEDLFRYHLLILGDVDPTIFTTRQMELMKEFTERLGGGMVFICGENHMPRSYRRTELGPVLPAVFDTGRDVGVDRSPRGLTQPFRPALTEAGKEHPITLLAENPDESEAIWRKLPGIFWHFPVTRAKPGAVPVLAHPTKSASGQPMPLVIASFYGAGRVVFLAIDETWRWRYGVEDLHFYRFWGQIIRYLRAGRQTGQGQRYSITTYKPEYVVGEEITVRARILDRAFRPVTLKEAEAAVALPGREEVKVPLEGLEPGIYEGRTRAIRAGTHEVRLTQPRPELEGERASSSFLVKRPDIEFRDTRADHQALVQLAQVSGGHFYHIDELARVADDLRAQRRLRVERAQFPLWNAPVLFLVFFAAICAEWVYRKRQRLL